MWESPVVIKVAGLFLWMEQRGYTRDRKTCEEATPLKLRHLHLQNVKGIKDLKLDFVDPVQKKIRDRTVIVGKNGSGKTTILETIFNVLSLLETKRKGMEEADLCLFSPGQTELVVDMEARASRIEQVKIRTGLYDSLFDKAPRVANILMGMQEVYPYVGETTAILFPVFDADDLGRIMLDHITYAVSGIEEEHGLGNLLHFPTDRLTRFDVRGEMTNEKPEYRWTYRYNRHHDKWKGSLESYLAWIYFRDLKLKENNPSHKSVFAEFTGIVNRFLEGKQIDTVGLDYRVQVIRPDSQNPLGLDALSSGEQQIVLLIGEIFRNIRRGSVLLIDEPELHLHPVWQRMFMETLTTLCKKFEAQLIVTTQSPRIAESVVGSEVINLDNLLEESRV